jgi:hypothetical protein
MMHADRRVVVVVATITVAVLLGAAAANTAALAATPSDEAASTVASTTDRAGDARPAGSDHIPPERPTENVTARFQISVSPDTTTGTFQVVVIYPARTEAEAAAARNGSLDPDWFRGKERVQGVFDARSDGEESLANGSTTVNHAATLAGREPTNPEHGWVTVRYETAWYGYLDGDTDLRIDEAYLSAVEADWELRVAIPSEWKPRTVAGDPVREPAGQQLTRYRWTTTDSLTPPLLVVADPVTTQSEEGSPLGVSAGLVPAIAALVLVLAWARRNTGTGSN